VRLALQQKKKKNYLQQMSKHQSERCTQNSKEHGTLAYGTTSI